MEEMNQGEFEDAAKRVVGEDPLKKMSDDELLTAARELDLSLIRLSMTDPQDVDYEGLDDLIPVDPEVDPDDKEYLHEQIEAAWQDRQDLYAEITARGLELPPEPGVDSRQA